MIAKTEAALVALAADCLPNVDVASGPCALDGGYIRRLLGNLPAVRVVFLGGDNPEPSSSFLNAEASWAVLVFTGWQGGNEKSRRVGVDAAYAILSRLAPIYHNALIEDETGAPISRVEVNEIENLWSSAWDLSNVAVYSIGLESTLVLDIEDQDLKGALDDFRSAGISFDLPGEGVTVDPDADPNQIGEVGDLVGRVDLPQ